MFRSYGTTLTWWPGFAALLDIMLALPLRGFQARWLDSGEGDEVELDLQTLKGLSQGKRSRASSKTC